MYVFAIFWLILNKLLKIIIVMPEKVLNKKIQLKVRSFSPPLCLTVFLIVKECPSNRAFPIIMRGMELFSPPCMHSLSLSLS